jgi:hypothetical protein
MAFGPSRFLFFSWRKKQKIVLLRALCVSAVNQVEKSTVD